MIFLSYVFLLLGSLERWGGACDIKKQNEMVSWKKQGGNQNHSRKGTTVWVMQLDNNTMKLVGTSVWIIVP